jgi:nitrous oxidase accessory protein
VRASLIVLALYALSRTWPKDDPHDAPPAAPASETGPARRLAASGNIVARDERELASLLAQANGPLDIELGARVYHGDFSIKRPVNLHGDGQSIIEGSGHDTVISIESDDVSLSNLTVRHSGRRQSTEDAAIRAKGARVTVSHVAVDDALFGITLGPCPHCLVENCRVTGLSGDTQLRGDGIKLWESSDSLVRDNVVEGVRDVVVWYSRRVLLERNTVRHSRYGTHFMYAHDSIVRDSFVADNTVGIFVMYSSRLRVERNVLAGARGAAGMGIGFKESDGVALSGNWLVANTTGVYLDRTPLSASQPVVFSHNVIALNEVAMGFLGAEGGLHFEGNDFRENINLVEFDAGGQPLQARFLHNRWSDYAGYDLNHDGVGDVPFQLKQLSRELIDETPELRLFQGTAAFGLIDAVAHVVPVLSSRVLLTDSAPAMSTSDLRKRL